MQCGNNNYSIMPLVPSAPPTSVSVSDVTSSTISIQWGTVECIHRNGDITGYSVMYSVVGSGSVIVLPVVESSQITLSGLVSSTNYSIQVAAVNNAGIGVFSDAITTTTQESESKLYITVYMNPCHACAVWVTVSCFVCVFACCCLATKG